MKTLYTVALVAHRPLMEKRVLSFAWWRSVMAAPSLTIPREDTTRQIEFRLIDRCV